MSDLSVCSACQGTGEVLVTVPHTRCAYCGGDGSYKTYRCPVCGGAGVVPALEGPTVVCPECGGKAADGSSGLVCLHCRGRGVVPARMEAETMSTLIKTSKRHCDLASRLGVSPG